MNQQSACVG